MPAIRTIHDGATRCDCDRCCIADDTRGNPPLRSRKAPTPLAVTSKEPCPACHQAITDIPEAIERFKAAERAGLIRDCADMARGLARLALQMQKAADKGDLFDMAWQIGTATTQLGTCAALKRSLEDLARYENLADALRAAPKAVG